MSITHFIIIIIIIIIITVIIIIIITTTTITIYLFIVLVSERFQRVLRGLTSVCSQDEEQGCCPPGSLDVSVASWMQGSTQLLQSKPLQ